MEWLELPSQNGYFWYIDADYREPMLALVSGTETSKIIVDVDGFDHQFDDIKEDGPRFYGPINLDAPDVPDAIDEILQGIEDARWSFDEME